MKKLFFLFTLMLASLCMYAQTTQSHIVQRGETIESIAKKYGISVSDLQQANPSAKEYFFVGMKLIIPSTNIVNKNNDEIDKEVSNQSQEVINPSTLDVDEEGNSEKESSEKESLNGKWTFMDEVGVFIAKEGKSKSLTAFSFQVGGIYNFSNMFGISLGPALDASLYEVGGEYKTSYQLRIPVTARLYLMQRRHIVDIVPFAGLYPSYVFKAKKFSGGGHAGVDLIIAGFKVGVSWVKPFTNNAKPAFNVHIGYDVEI